MNSNLVENSGVEPETAKRPQSRTVKPPQALHGHPSIRALIFRNRLTIFADRQAFAHACNYRI